MKDLDQRTLALFEELYIVIEKGGYSYQETIDALSELLNCCKSRGQTFLNDASFTDITRH